MKSKFDPQKHHRRSIRLKEYDYSPYNCFRNTVQTGEGKFIIKHLDGKIPMVYSVLAKKKNPK